MEDLYCWQAKFESCDYSERLIRKLVLLNKKSNYKIDLHQIKKAIYYAKKYHGDQKRDSGEPFYTHPLAVAEMVVDYRFETNILVTSILHDTLEDTKLTKSTLEYLFDVNIAKQVEDLTRVKLDRKISVEEMVDYLWQQRINDDLLLIKYFDRLHNLQTISVKSHLKAIKTIKQTFKKFLSLSFYFKDNYPEMSTAHQKMFGICRKHLVVKPYLANVKSNFFQDHVQLPSLIDQNVTLQTKNQ